MENLKYLFWNYEFYPTLLTVGNRRISWFDEVEELLGFEIFLKSVYFGWNGNFDHGSPLSGTCGPLEVWISKISGKFYHQISKLKITVSAEVYRFQEYFEPQQFFQFIESRYSAIPHSQKSGVKFIIWKKLFEIFHWMKSWPCIWYWEIFEFTVVEIITKPLLFGNRLSVVP